MASKPTIVIVPGAWQLPSNWEYFISILETAGYPTKYVKPPTLGGTTTPLASLVDDVSAVREVLISLVNEQREIVVLCHSAGGLVASNAVEGLYVESRKSAGFKGGVSRLIYISAFMIPKGKSLIDMLGGQPLPWMKLMGDRVVGIKDMLPEVAFNDLSGSELEKWAAEVTHSALGLFTSPSEFEPWTTSLPISYVFCAKDHAIPYAVQQQMAEQGGEKLTSATVDASHVPFISMPQKLFSAIEELIH